MTTPEEKVGRAIATGALITPASFIVLIVKLSSQDSTIEEDFKTYGGL
jgi:hypothetical protein